MTVKELFDIFESSYMRLKLKPTTVNGYLVNINNHILPYIGDKELSEIALSAPRRTAARDKP